MKRKCSPSTAASDSDDPQARGTAVSLDLDCRTCHRPLTSPIYQCDLEHVVCSVCRMYGSNCPMCAQPSGSTRCFGLEIVIEKLRVPCKYAEKGCPEKHLLFKAKSAHEDRCLYSTCLCPFYCCTFQGLVLQLSSHFDTKHPGTVVFFKYSASIELSLSKSGSPQAAVPEG